MGSDDTDADPSGGAVAMESIWLLAILACPLVMGVMMRGTRRDDRTTRRDDKDR